MAKFTPTAILLVNGEPVAHTKGNSYDLCDVLFERYGALANSWTGTVSDANELDNWCSCDSGIITPAVMFHKESKPDEDIDFYILLDPWYTSSLQDESMKDAVYRYCEEHGIPTDGGK